MKRKNYFKKKIIGLLLILITSSIFGQTVDLYNIETNPNAKSTVYVTFVDHPKTVYEANPLALKNLLDNVSDIYSPFDVNFTTNESIYLNTPTKNRGRIEIVNGGGGQATDRAFGQPIPISAIVGYNQLPSNNPNHFPSLVAAFTHEFGHTLSLVHDACPTSTGCTQSNYLHGDGFWTPALGLLGTSQNTTIHFYNGYKNSAHTNTDDIAVVGSQLGFVPDDIDTITMFLLPTGAISSQNHGAIQNQQDLDNFSFKTEGGNVDILVKNAIDSILHPTLKVGAKIFDSNGQKVLTGTEEGWNSMQSRLTGTLPAGRYIVQVDGIGHKVNGGYTDMKAFNDYSSHGAYYISGTITNGVQEDISDLNIVKNSPVEKVNCGEKLDFSVTFANSGTVNITSIDVTVKNNGAVINSFTKNVDLTPRQKMELPLLINTKFSGELLVEILPTGENDPTLSNNTISLGNVQLSEGEKMNFKITKIGTEQNTFSVTIRDNENASTVKAYTYTDLVSSSDVDFLDLNTCLAKGCYDIEVKDVFLPHNSTTSCPNASIYKPSSAYSKDQEVIYNNKHYKAKWAIHSHGEIPGEDQWGTWMYIGECKASTNSNSFTLNIDTHTSETTNAGNFDRTNGYTKTVCIKTVTSQNDIVDNTANEITVYPNPTNGEFTISAKNLNDYSSINISTTTGKIVHKQLIKKDSTTVFVSKPEFKSGVYFVQLIGNKQTKTIKINIQ